MPSADAFPPRAAQVKGPWLAEEDDVVREMVLKYGVGQVKWSVIASKLPGRIGKQCRERWFNHLDPAIKKGGWVEDEDLLIFQAQRAVRVARCRNVAPPAPC